MQLGFVGTGTMGNPMSRRLLAAGHDLTVHDLRQEATANLIALGARWADSPRAVAEASEVIFTSLPGPVEVESAVFNPSDGILAGLQPGSTYIDLSTNSPALFRKIAEACRARGADALDAPVSGGSTGAENGTLTIMVGGDPTTFAKYRSLLECLGKNIFYMGETGKGMVAKGINQFLTFANFLVQAEGLVIGAKAGLDVETLAQALAVSSGRNPQLEAFPRTVFKGDFTLGIGPGGPLNRWVKDVGCAGEVARDVLAPSPILVIAEDVLHRAQAQGWGEQVWYAAAQVLEQMAGVQLRAAH